MGNLFSSSPRIISTEQVRAILRSELPHLQQIFNKIKRNENISLATFKMCFLPQNTPNDIVKKLYDVYATSHSSKEMNYDDFLEIYLLFGSKTISY